MKRVNPNLFVSWLTIGVLILIVLVLNFSPVEIPLKLYGLILILFLISFLDFFRKSLKTELSYRKKYGLIGVTLLLIYFVYRLFTY